MAVNNLRIKKIRAADLYVLKTLAEIQTKTTTHVMFTVQICVTLI